MDDIPPPPPPPTLDLATKSCPTEAPLPGTPIPPTREGFSPLPTGQGGTWPLARAHSPGPHWVLWVGDSGEGDSGV